MIDLLLSPTVHLPPATVAAIAAANNNLTDQLEFELENADGRALP